jgi:hypothetical protein
MEIAHNSLVALARKGAQTPGVAEGLMLSGYGYGVRPVIAEGSRGTTLHFDVSCGSLGGRDIYEFNVYQDDEGAEYMTYGAHLVQIKGWCSLCDAVPPLPEFDNPPCLGEDMFPRGENANETMGLLVETKQMCVDCPYLGPCASYAMELGLFLDGTGVWGGTSPSDRRKARLVAVDQ